MKPVRVIYNCDAEEFEKSCATALSEGYVVNSTNSAVTGDCQDEFYQAIFVFPVSHTKEEKIDKTQQLKAEIAKYYDELNNTTDIDGILIFDVMARLKQLQAVE